MARALGARKHRARLPSVVADGESPVEGLATYSATLLDHWAPISTATTCSGLHFFLTTDIGDIESAEAVEHQLMVGRMVSEVLEVVIRQHASTADLIVIEPTG